MVKREVGILIQTHLGLQMGEMAETLWYLPGFFSEQMRAPAWCGRVCVLERARLSLGG